MLHVHHADHADHLVAALGEVLRPPPADPFASEVVAVHSRGIERWVAQQLSLTLGAGPGRSDGIAAGLDFPFPGRLVADAITRATGSDPATDPWRPERLSWPLLEVVSAAERDGEVAHLGPLAVHVTSDGGSPSPRRLGAVRRVADLFDRYATHRPALLQAWADGTDGADVDGLGDRLAARFAWQPWLWRRLRERVAVASPPERLEAAVANLAAGTGPDGQPLALDLPDRLSLFGLTALPVTYLEVLAGLANGPTPTAPAGRDVHLFLLHPSPALWRRLSDHLAGGTDDGVRAHATRTTRLPRRDLDPTRTLPRHPFLAAWGRDARELQVVAAAAPSATLHDPVPAADHGPPGDDAPLLARLQADVRADRAPHAPGHDDRRPTLAASDRSVQVHRCHGRTRQVEVLRDVLLGLLADHDDLEPRDVVVLCPDIEAFAPTVAAVFGSHAVTPTDGGTAGVPDLRVQLADRALRRTNPVLRVVAEVLDLVDDRVTASAVLELCTRAPVRARFGFGEQELERLEDRLGSSGIRWGLDGAHRREHDVPTAVNTWRTGLDRLLVGVAVEDGHLRTVGGVPPEPRIDGGEVELVGRTAELMSRLQHAVARLRGPQPLDAWLEALADVAAQLCAVTDDDHWQHVQLTRLLDDVREAATVAGGDPDLPLTLVEVRDLLGDRLQGSPSRAAHRTGDLTVCTLVPMRSVPHRVVVLLGMDDEVFPRRTVPDGDDLLAAAPLIGDRDARTEDRQLLLDALLAAGSHLVVLTTGHDERTGDPRPPAVPIGELLDVVDRTVRTGISADGGGEVAASTLITADHPLQPFAASRFTAGGTGHPARPAAAPDQPFGFDADDLAAARAAAGPTAPPPPFLSLAEPLPAQEVADGTALADLRAFLTHPCRALLRQRLQLTFPRDGEVPDDALPVELPRGLGRWHVGDRLFAAVAAGHSLDRALEVERARGLLPPGHLADDALDEIVATVRTLVAAAADLDVDLRTPGGTVDVDVTLPDGRRVRGAVDDVVGTVRRRSSYSRLAAGHRLEAWVDVLALTVQDPTQPWSAVTLGNARGEAGKRRKRDAVASLSRIGPHDEVIHRTYRGERPLPCALGPPDADPQGRRDRAARLLGELLDLRDTGLAGPLPLPCRTAHAYAYAAWLGDLGLAHPASTPTGKASSEWTTPDRAPYGKEDRDEANRMVLGDLTIGDLVGLPPEAGEDGDGWFVDVEDGRLGRLARRVWWPLLGSEQLDDLW